MTHNTDLRTAQQSKSGERPIIGALEAVVLPNGQTVIAKTDTGALSASVHCEQIKEVQTEGKTILQFHLSGAKGPALLTDNFRKVYIRSSNGQVTERYAVQLDVMLGDRSYNTRVTLSRRHDMHYMMLIGKRFLLENDMLVDVSKEFVLSKKPDGR